jgi:hypothetical protein
MRSFYLFVVINDQLKFSFRFILFPFSLFHSLVPHLPLHEVHTYLTADATTPTLMETKASSRPHDHAFF